MLSETKYFHCTGAYLLTIGSTGAREFLTWFLPSSREVRPTGHRPFRQASGCVNFYWPSWTVFERVCKISNANSILIKLLTHEPLSIVRSRTKNYKPYLNQVSFIFLWHLRLERSLIFEIESLARIVVTNWGVSFRILYETKLIINFSFKTHVSRIRLSFITENYH